jgi:hypothetical protein
MLTIHDVVKDYAAILDRVGPDGTPRDAEGLTLEENLVDLGWHQKEFQLRRSFAYTMMNADETVCLGCVYLYPTEDADARVHMWVRRSAWEDGLDPVLEAAVREWVAREWPFETVSYPGRGA